MTSIDSKKSKVSKMRKFASNDLMRIFPSVILITPVRYAVNSDHIRIIQIASIQSLRLFTLDKKSSYTAPINKGTYFVHFKKLPPNTDIEKMKPFFIDCYGKDNKLIPWAECAE